VHITKTGQSETKRELKLQYHCHFVKTQHKKYDSKYYKKKTTCKKNESSNNPRKGNNRGIQTRVPTCVSSSDNPTLALVLTFSTDNFLRPEGLGATFRVEEEGITHRSCHNACRFNAVFN